jgi:hypothetical protein
MGAILLVLAARARRHWRSRLRLPAHRPDGAGELRGVGQLPAAAGRGGDTVRRRHAGSPAGGERVALPGWLIAALAAGVLVAAIAIAIVPAVAAARSRAGPVLHTE